MGRIFNGGVDVLFFEERIAGQNLVEAGTVGEKFKNVGHTNTLSANAGSAPAFALFNGDSFESFGAHRLVSGYSKIRPPARCGNSGIKHGTASRSAASRPLISRLPYTWENEALKATIEIPDALFRRAKSAAAERGVPLRALVTEALADKLRADPNNGKPWMKGFGKLRHLHKETTRRLRGSIGLSRTSSGRSSPRI
jgi:hypothetical protein